MYLDFTSLCNILRRVTGHCQSKTEQLLITETATACRNHMPQQLVCAVVRHNFAVDGQGVIAGRTAPTVTQKLGPRYEQLFTRPPRWDCCLTCYGITTEEPLQSCLLVLCRGPFLRRISKLISREISRELCELSYTGYTLLSNWDKWTSSKGVNVVNFELPAMMAPLHSQSSLTVRSHSHSPTHTQTI